MPNGVFSNARTDAYITGLENPLEQSLSRAKCYESVGADGIFVPCITKMDDIKQLVNAVNIPLNVMCMPDLPNFALLEKIGVKCISMGPFLYNMLQDNMEKTIGNLIDEQSFAPMFG